MEGLFRDNVKLLQSVSIPNPPPALHDSLKWLGLCLYGRSMSHSDLSWKAKGRIGTKTDINSFTLYWPLL